jgi:hypothetical protein
MRLKLRKVLLGYLISNLSPSRILSAEGTLTSSSKVTDSEGLFDAFTAMKKDIGSTNVTPVRKVSGVGSFEGTR